MKIGFGRRHEYITDDYKLKENVKVIEEVDTIEKANKWLNNKLKEIGFKSYYKNINFVQENNLIEIDFGDWSYFCYYFDLSDENWEELLGD